MIKNILVPVDGSEGADRAIEKAVMLAEICGAKLNFLYVANINQLAINAVLSDAILDSVTKAGNVILDRALEMVPAGIAKESFSDTGSPAVVVLDFAEIESIGQGFADEIFRVYCREHPEVDISFIHVNSSIRRMIDHVRNTK